MQKMKKIIIVAAAAVVSGAAWAQVTTGIDVPAQAQAQDGFGRGALAPAPAQNGGMGRAPLDRVVVNTAPTAGLFEIGAGLGYGPVWWQIGSAKGSERTFSPSVHAFYKASDLLDVGLTLAFFSGEETKMSFVDDGVVFNKTSLDVTKLALGARVSSPGTPRFAPYISGGLAYYFTNADLDLARDLSGGLVRADVSAKDGFGISLEGGAGYQVTDAFFLTGALGFDYLLGPGKVDVNGRDFNLRFGAFMVKVGAAFYF